MIYSWQQSKLGSEFTVQVDIDDEGFSLICPSNNFRVDFSAIESLRYKAVYAVGTYSHILEIRHSAGKAHMGFSGFGFFGSDKLRIRGFALATSEILKRYTQTRPDAVVQLGMSRKMEFVTFAIVLLVALAIAVRQIVSDPLDSLFWNVAIVAIVLFCCVPAWFLRPGAGERKQIQALELAADLERLASP